MLVARLLCCSAGSDSDTRVRLRPLSIQAAQQSQGIQTLLEAEKEAAKIVQKARTCGLSSTSRSRPHGVIKD